MKLANLALVSTFGVLGVLAIGCASAKPDDKSNNDGPLASSESQLVEDGTEASDLEDDLQAGVEDPLSGAAASDPGSPAEGATDAELMDKVRKNPGLFFKPAGCITTTVNGNVATHVFNDCTGPYGMVHFNGTVTSTYVREPGKLTITHEAKDFHLNGATVSGKRVVVYTKNGTVYTKTRNGEWTGQTAKGHPLSHTASFTSTYDASTKCITRDGAATTTIGGREFDWSISGYKRCGIGSLGCPDSGKIILSRTKGGDTASLTIEFLGGPSYRVTLPSGRQVNGKLICRAA